MLSTKTIAGFEVQCLSFGLHQPYSIVTNSTSLLRIATAPFMVNTGGNTHEICGYMATLLTTLATHLKSNFVFDIEKNLGKKLPNDSYDGLIGRLDRNASDLILAPLIYTPVRLEVAELSLQVAGGHQFVLMDSPKRKSRNLWPIFDVFTLGNWLFLFLLFLIHSLISLKKHKFSNFLTSLFDHFKVALEQGLSITESRSYRTAFLANWFFLAFAYATLFANEMLANLTASPTFTVDTLEQLINDDSFKVIAFRDMLIYKTFIKDLPLNDRLETVDYIADLKHFYSRLISENVVMIRDEDAIDSCIRSNRHLPLHKGEGKFLMIGTIPVSRRSSAKKSLLRAMKTLAESGLQQHFEVMKGLTTLTNTQLFSDDSKFKRLGVIDVFVIYLLFAIGITLAVSALGIEYVCKYFI